MDNQKLGIFITELRKGLDTGTVSAEIERDRQSCLKVGTWCFPNKKILRNSPCLPACKQKNIATRLRDTT